jgi:hypothetical protein
MARTASVPFVAYATADEAKSNRPVPQTKKDGTEASPLNLYEVKLPGIDAVYVWSRSPVIAIGQTAQHKQIGECVLAEKPDRTPMPPALRAKKAFAKLSDTDRAALLAELMGTKPTNGESQPTAPAPQTPQRGGRKQHA